MSKASAISNEAIAQFLKTHGYHDWARRPIAGDASTRRYEVLSQAGEPDVILMIAPRGAEAPAEPEGANAADRLALGYNAVSRLAGPNLEAFASIATELHARGFGAPQIHAADIDQGLLISEHFGEMDVPRALMDNLASEREIYEKAVDVLAAIYRSSFPDIASYQGYHWRLRDYDELALQAEADLMLDWYMPYFGEAVSDKAKAKWRDIWAACYGHLSAHAPGLALRDYHAQNIFWVDESVNVSRIGLIDFQDALMAHPAYDLVSLLEDARRDVDPAIVEPLIQRFCEKAGLPDDDEFRAAYAVLGAQRNAKILGIFVRLAKRDGKQSYLDLIPRVKAHFQNDLAHPALSELRRWLADYHPDVVS